MIPWEVIAEYDGPQLEGVKYEQLMPYAQPDESEGEAFRVIIGDFVSTEEGTGIVHTASIFGADDFRVCLQNNVPSILVKDEKGGLSVFDPGLKGKIAVDGHDVGFHLWLLRLFGARPIV